MLRFFEGLQRHRLWAFLGLLLLVGASGMGLKQAFTINNSLEIWFVENDPNLVAYRKSMQTFGNDEVVSIYFEPPKGLLAPETIKAVRELSNKLERLKFVQRVYSLTTVKDFVLLKTKDPETGDVDEQLKVPKLVPRDNLSAAERKRIRAKLKSDPVYAGWIVSRKHDGLFLTVQFRALKDIDQKRGVYNEQILALTKTVLHGAGEIDFHAAGIQLAYTELNKAQELDTAIFAFGGFLVIFILLALILRSIWGLVISLTVIVLTTCLMMGIFGLLGHQSNVMLQILPTLVAIVSIADSVHLIQHFRKDLAKAGGSDKQCRLDTSPRTLTAMAWPCFLTSLTTFVGFMSLLVSEMRLLRELGLFAAIGVLLALLVTYVVCAFFFPLVTLKPIQTESGRADKLVGKMLESCRRLVYRSPAGIVLGFALLSGLLIWGMTKLEADIYTLGFFPDSARIVKDDKVISERFGPYQPLEFVLKTKAGQDGAVTPQFLRKLARWQKESQTIPAIGESFSIADILFKLNRVNFGKAELPTSRAVSSQLLDTMGDRDVTDPYLEPVERSLARVIFKTNLTSGNEAAKTIERLHKLGQTIFGSQVEIKPAGYWPLYATLVTYARTSQVDGFGLAFVVILGVFFLLFRNLKLCSLAMLPNLFPVLLALGLMGFAGIHLDMATVSIASIVICIAVDDTIHFTYHLQQGLKEHAGNAKAAIDAAFSNVGFALFATSLILACGFSVFAFASVTTIKYFGTYLAIAVIGALAADLLLYPALVLLLSKRPVESEASG